MLEARVRPWATGPPDQGELGTLELQGTSRGHQGYREFDAEWRSAWDAYWLVPQELIDLGDGYLIIVQMAGHAGGSTLTVTQPAAILEELDDRGMIIREQRFTDPAQALNMLGLVADDAEQRADRRGHARGLAASEIAPNPRRTANPRTRTSLALRTTSRRLASAQMACATRALR